MCYLSRASNATPGTRALHLVLERGAELISMLDLFGCCFVLLAGEAARRRAAAAVSERQRIPLACHIVGTSDDLRDHAGLLHMARARAGLCSCARTVVAARWPYGGDAEGKLSEVVRRLAFRETSKEGRDQ